MPQMFCASQYKSRMTSGCDPGSTISIPTSQPVPMYCPSSRHSARVLSPLGVETQIGDAVVRRLQLDQLAGEIVPFPFSQFAGLVIGEPVGAGLVGGQMRGDVHRHLAEPELECCAEAGVPANDDAGPVHDDRLVEPEVAYGGRDGRYSPIVVARIVFVGFDSLDIPPLDNQSADLGRSPL